MTDVTQILGQIENGDPSAAEQLLPLVYEELCRLAGARMAQEGDDHTLQPTALVHEAYLRLVNVAVAQHWDSRGHFFSAAAEAMRRILIEQARRKGRLKRGGERNRIPIDRIDISTSTPSDELLAIDNALDRLATEDPLASELVKLKFFAGFSIPESASILGISRSTAYQLWSYARAWLQCEIQAES